MGGRWEEPSWDKGPRPSALQPSPTPSAFLPALFQAVSLVPRTVPGIQEALTECFCSERPDREPGSVRRARLEVARWLWVGQGLVPPAPARFPVPLCPVHTPPTWSGNGVSHVYPFLLCLSMSDCEDLSRPWALTCYSTAPYCSAGVAATLWTCSP